MRRWRVVDVRCDGSVLVDRLEPRRRGKVLPSMYVGEYLDLGYAVTAHRALGITADTSHVVATPTTTLENLYVSMSKGRESKFAYATLGQPDDGNTTAEPEYALYRGIDRLTAELARPSQTLSRTASPTCPASR